MRKEAKIKTPGTNIHLCISPVQCVAELRAGAGYQFEESRENWKESWMEGNVERKTKGKEKIQEAVRGTWWVYF